MNLNDQFHSLSELFAQLGLPADANSIETFLKKHSPLSEQIHLWEAPWWNAAQAEFLHEAMKADAEWAMAADELNTRLRKI